MNLPLPLHPPPALSTPRGGMSASPASPPIGSAGPPSPMSFPSGVVHVQQSRTPAEPHPLSNLSTPGSVMAPIISAPIVAPRPKAQKSSAWIVVVMIVVLLAIGGGATLALMYR